MKNTSRFCLFCLSLFIFLVFGNTLMACPGCTEKNAWTRDLLITASLFSIWITAFVIAWFKVEEELANNRLRLVICAGLLASAMPSTGLWIGALFYPLFTIPLVFPLNFGTIIGFPALFLMGLNKIWKKPDVNRWQEGFTIIGFLLLGVLIVQIFPFINYILDGPHFSYGAELGRSYAMPFLLARPLPLVLLALLYVLWMWKKSHPFFLSIIMLLALFSVWLSLPIYELNGFDWFISFEGRDAAHSRIRLMPLFLSFILLFKLIPLATGIYCVINRKKLGLKRNAWGLLVIGILIIIASLIVKLRD